MNLEGTRTGRKRTYGIPLDSDCLRGDIAEEVTGCKPLDPTLSLHSDRIGKRPTEGETDGKEARGKL